VLVHVLLSRLLKRFSQGPCATGAMRHQFGILMHDATTRRLGLQRR
jgi:hypothetical protein